MISPDEEVTTLAREVDQYLAAHPHAADSLEGVARWWLNQGRSEPAMERMKQALDELVGAGIVAARRSIDGQIIYSRAPRRGESNDVQ